MNKVWSYRKATKQLVVSREGNRVRFETYTVDIENELTPLHSFTVSMFHNPIDLSDTDQVMTNKDLLYNICKAIGEGNYPNNSMMGIYNKFSDFEKEGLNRMCEKSNCLCPLFFSIGCPKLVKGDGGKITTNLISALSSIYGKEMLSTLLGLEERRRKRKVDRE